MGTINQCIVPRFSWLRFIREGQNKSIADVAKACGIHGGSYTCIERGYYSPRKENAKKIADYLGFPAKMFAECPLDAGCAPLDWLRFLRIQKYTIAGFADDIGVSHTTYRTIEHGNFLEINPTLKQTIADKLGFPVSYFDNPPELEILEIKRSKKTKKEPKPLPPWRTPEYTAQRQTEKERCRMENEARLKRADRKQTFLTVDVSGNISGGWLEYVTSNNAKMRRYE